MGRIDLGVAEDGGRVAQDPALRGGPGGVDVYLREVNGVCRHSVFTVGPSKRPTPRISEVVIGDFSAAG